MARGSFMCGRFISLSVPKAILLSSLGCIIIGGPCLGVGNNMSCRDSGSCLRSDDLRIAGSIFLTLAGILMPIALVMLCVMCCCPQTTQNPQPHPSIPYPQLVPAMGPPNGYPGPTAFGGGSANQVYALVPVHPQQQNGALVYLNKYQDPANTPTATAPCAGTLETPAATPTVPVHY